MSPRPGLFDAHPETVTPAAALRAAAQALEALAAVVDARAAEPDELVAIAPEPLAALGLEHRAVARLVADGRLRAVSIGRRTFTTRARLVALVGELEPVPTRRERAEVRDDLLVAVAKAGKRRSRASARTAVAASDARLGALPKCAREEAEAE